jgi:hypothetical protein
MIRTELCKWKQNHSNMIIGITKFLRSLYFASNSHTPTCVNPRMWMQGRYIVCSLMNRTKAEKWYFYVYSRVNVLEFQTRIYRIKNYINNFALNFISWKSVNWRGARLRLWTAATNGTIVNPPGDTWAWRTMVVLYRQGNTTDAILPAESSSSKVGETWRRKWWILPSKSISCHTPQGSLTCRKKARRLYVPSEGRRAADFYRL